MVNRTQLLNAPKEVKRNMSFEEFKTHMRGVTLKTREDYIQAINWLYDTSGPVKGWYFYWQRGIDGRKK